MYVAIGGRGKGKWLGMRLAGRLSEPINCIFAYPYSLWVMSKYTWAMISFRETIYSMTQKPPQLPGYSTRVSTRLTNEPCLQNNSHTFNVGLLTKLVLEVRCHISRRTLVCSLDGLLWLLEGMERWLFVSSSKSSRTCSQQTWNL